MFDQRPHKASAGGNYLRSPRIARRRSTRVQIKSHLHVLFPVSYLPHLFTHLVPCYIPVVPLLHLVPCYTSCSQLHTLFPVTYLPPCYTPAAPLSHLVPCYIPSALLHTRQLSFTACSLLHTCCPSYTLCSLLHTFHPFTYLSPLLHTLLLHPLQSCHPSCTVYYFL